MIAQKTQKQVMNVLMTNEGFVRSATALSDNVGGKYLTVAIREAQEIGLRNIVGSALLLKMKAVIYATEYPEGSFNADFAMDFDLLGPAGAGVDAYLCLVDRCQYFLAYRAAAEAVRKVAWKVSNVGVHRDSDENVQQASRPETEAVIADYMDKSDYYARLLQAWLIEHRATYPELSEWRCRDIRSALYSSATSGVWLGGARGKVLPGGGGWRR